MLVITSVDFIEDSHYFKIELNGLIILLAASDPKRPKGYNSVIFLFVMILNPMN
jgi:hypothetical protein